MYIFISYVYVYIFMYICEDTGCCPEDLPSAMNDREEWRERVRDIRATSVTWWWMMIYILCICIYMHIFISYVYIYIAFSRGDNATEVCERGLPLDEEMVPILFYHKTLHWFSFYIFCISSFTLFFLPSYSCVSTIVWWHHLNFYETSGEKARFELPKDAARCFEQILVVARYNTIAARPLNHPSSVYGRLTIVGYLMPKPFRENSRGII